MRGPEGIETPLPGRTSERPGQNTENQTFATQRPRVRVPSPPQKAWSEGLKWDPQKITKHS